MYNSSFDTKDIKDSFLELKSIDNYLYQPKICKYTELIEGTSPKWSHIKHIGKKSSSSKTVNNKQSQDVTSNRNKFGCINENNVNCE